MSQRKSAPRHTPIPHYAQSGRRAEYYVLSDDGVQHIPVTRSECLARTEEPNNPFPQFWYVDEEAAFVVRLPRNKAWDFLVGDNWRFVWRVNKAEERSDACPFVNTVKCDGWKTSEDGRRECEYCQWDHMKRILPLDAIKENEDGRIENRFNFASEDDVAELYEYKERLEKLCAALDTLEPMDSDILRDIFFGGKTARELAPKYGFENAKSIGRHKQRALKQLRENEDLKNYFK
jgi:hypothetical protein